MINTDDVLSIKKDKLELNSGLSEQDFARSRLAQYMTEDGLLCKPDGNGSFTTEAFRFTGTAVQEGSIILSAPAFKGQPLLSYIQSAMTEQSVSKKKSRTRSPRCRIPRRPGI